MRRSALRRMAWLQLKRIRRAEPGGRIGLEIQARAGDFGGRYETEIPIAHLLRFVSCCGQVEMLGVGTVPQRSKMRATIPQSKSR